MNAKFFYFFLINFVYTINLFAQDGFRNSGNFRMHANANVAFFGDLTNNGNFDNNLGTVTFSGSSLQNINGSQPVQSSQIVLQNANNVKLDNRLLISGTMSFVNGRIISDRADIGTEFVHFLGGSSYTGANGANHIDGVVRKTGNTAFTFPTGNAGLYRPISIGTPALATDHFTGYYLFSDPNGNGYSDGLKDPAIHHISDCEFWIMNRTSGSSQVPITLSYDNLGTNGCSGVLNQNELLVARWDGAMWKNQGNGLTSGTFASGTITTAGAVNSFSPFTLATSTFNNPLPVELLYFSASKMNDREILTFWATAAEINSDYFEVEKSDNGMDWQTISRVSAQINSSQLTNYELVDYSPFSGVSYYRLKQVDQDGKYKYSKIVKVEIESKNLKSNVFPNPASSNMVIVCSDLHRDQISWKLFDLQGKFISIDQQISKISDSIFQFDISSLTQGVYLLELSSNQLMEVIRIEVMAN